MASTATLRIWIKALRAEFLTASLVPVTLGIAVAWAEGSRVHWLYAILTLVGVSFLHLGANLANDYFDHTSRNDEVNQTPTPFSGGSRVIQEGLLRPRTILTASIVFCCLGLVLGLYLNHERPGNMVLALGLVGLFCGFFYSASPLRLGYRGVGELLVAISFGPLVVIGSYYVQTGALAWSPLWPSLAVALLIFEVLYINEFPDYEADKEVGKRTLVVILGRERGWYVYAAALAGVYLWILVAATVVDLMPAWCLLALVTLPIAIWAVWVARTRLDRVYEMLPANACTIILHLVIGLLLSAGYVLERSLAAR